MVLTELHPLPGKYDSAFGDEPKGRQSSPCIRKLKYHYGWDWGPRIVAQGIWKPVRLEAWDTARIGALTITQEAVSPAEARATANLSVPTTHAADSAKPVAGIGRKSIWANMRLGRSGIDGADRRSAAC